MTNNENKTSNPGGVGFTGALTIVFVVLRLCGVINWSWIWVLFPFWGSIALAVIISVVICAVRLWGGKS